MSNQTRNHATLSDWAQRAIAPDTSGTHWKKPKRSLLTTRRIFVGEQQLLSKEGLIQGMIIGLTNSIIVGFTLKSCYMKIYLVEHAQNCLWSIIFLWPCPFLSTHFYKMLYHMKYEQTGDETQCLPLAKLLILILTL